MTMLHDAFDALLLAKGQELADTVPVEHPRITLATVSFAMGMQTALELSQLSPTTARELIEALHRRQAADEPGAEEEFNQNALDFLHLYHPAENGTR
jgi:hypothetical protein